MSIITKIINLIIAAMLLSIAGSAAFASSDPNGSTASTTPPFMKAPSGQPPPIGSGQTPAPVIPGMGGPSTLTPWVPAVPADQINVKNSGIPIPFGPPIATPPGTLGPLLTPFVPAPPSTPGTDPGMLSVPPYTANPGAFNPAEQVQVNQGGGLPGTGGYATTIPTVRRGGQQTHQWEYRGRNSSLIPGLGDGSQSEVTLLGPYAGYGVPYGVPTGDGLRNSSVDLGGGQTFKVGGTKLATGTTVQDYGLNYQRNSSIVGISNNQSTDYGQGFWREPTYSSNTTDFGLPYKQFIAPNENPQKQAQLLPPKAVETNF